MGVSRGTKGLRIWQDEDFKEFVEETELRLFRQWMQVSATEVSQLAAIHAQARGLLELRTTVMSAAVEGKRHQEREEQLTRRKK